MSGGNPYFVGARGTPGGDQLTNAGMAQMGLNAGGYGFNPYGGMGGGGMLGGSGGNMGGGYGGTAQNPYMGPGSTYGIGGGYSPAMQQILQARGMGGGPMGGMAGGNMGGMMGGGYGYGGMRGPNPYGQLFNQALGGGNAQNQGQSGMSLQSTGQQPPQQQAGGGGAV
jgi:hypothetical protein